MMGNPYSTLKTQKRPRAPGVCVCVCACVCVCVCRGLPGAGFVVQYSACRVLRHWTSRRREWLDGSKIHPKPVRATAYVTKAILECLFGHVRKS
eukprot:8305150-Pyramimonas_sp.AAC.1